MRFASYQKWRLNRRTRAWNKALYNLWEAVQNREPLQGSIEEYERAGRALPQDVELHPPKNYQGV